MKIILGLIFISLFISGVLFSLHKNETVQLTSTSLYPNPKQLDGFKMIDQNGQTFTNANLEGKWSVLFFGYTFCPDICPTTMLALAQVANKLNSEQLKKVQFVFVSVDPERDTVERLAEYIPFYHPDFIAITGDAEQLEAFSLNLGAMYMKLPSEDSYTMSHSGTLFIINPDGQRYGVFTRSPLGVINIIAVTEDLKKILH